MEGIRRPLARSSLAGLLFAVLTVGAFICTRYLDSSTNFIAGNPRENPILTTKTVKNDHPKITHNVSKIIEIPLNCSIGNQPKHCATNYYPSQFVVQKDGLLSEPPLTCPDYFRWIHDDLWPWRETGITEEMVMSARRTANFRLVILKGKAYVERYKKSFQSRDTFTLWGILQLLRRYPGKLPDLDLMFDCVDWPVIKKDSFKSPKHLAPPPLFRYCGDDSSFDIVFPDWSFWGWPEINLKGWDALSKELEEGNTRTKWTNREPYAYWKGNPSVAATRMDLLKCNVSDNLDWNARVYAQDWFREQQQGYRESNLASQCVHRYKIYIEGSAWSVSEKYIMACNSVTLLVEPHYYDFFTRNLMPLQHYWPIKDKDKCRSIKHAVDWGNTHQKKAQAIGKAASKFILEDLKMDYVYDYMFHILSEYSKLLKYKPSVPEKAVELCSESMACDARGVEKRFMIDSLVKGPSSAEPCTMPSPYSSSAFHDVIEKKNSSLKKVDKWEKQYWDSQTKHT